MPKFGPSFGDEIMEAGLGGAPFGWNGEGEIVGRESLTGEQSAKLDEVINAHDPEKPTRLMQHNQNPELKEFREWLLTATPEDIDKWVENTDAQYVLRVLVKSLAYPPTRG